MTAPARTMTGNNLRLFPSARPFSNFDFADAEFPDALSDFGFPLHRILSQARQHEMQAIVLEDIWDAKDIQEENEDIRALCPSFDASSSRCCRFSFFKEPVTSIESLASVCADSYLGYAVYKEDKVPPTPRVCPGGYTRGRIYESVLKWSGHRNNFVHGAPRWECVVADRRFEIYGYLYAQQNAVTNCCAHVALRSILPRFASRDVTYREINRIVEEFRHHQGNFEFFPGQGLDIQEITYVLTKFKIEPFVGDYTAMDLPVVPYQKYLYGAIESGFPAMLVFETGQEFHGIPVFGHTFNEDTWVGGADWMYFQYNNPTDTLSSGSWVSMYIAHDDNAGSNYCIPQNYIEARRVCDKSAGWLRKFIWRLRRQNCPLEPCKNQKGGVAYALGTLPAGIQVNPIEAETIGASCLLSLMGEIPQDFSQWTQKWQKRLERYHQHGLLVLRTLLVSGGQYSQHLQVAEGWAHGRFPDWLISAIAPLEDDLLWMIELSVPELFSANRRKVGELLLRSTQAANDSEPFSNFICARLPGCFVVLDESRPTTECSDHPPFIYIPLGLEDHIELFGCEDINAAS